jgi:hypothetical protein
MGELFQRQHNQLTATEQSLIVEHQCEIDDDLFSTSASYFDASS